jgi:hypothetical protein
LRRFFAHSGFDLVVVTDFILIFFRTCVPLGMCEKTIERCDRAGANQGRTLRIPPIAESELAILIGDLDVPKIGKENYLQPLGKLVASISSTFAESGKGFFG